MNNIEKIKRVQTLQEQKSVLEKQLANVNSQIEDIANNCEHVAIILNSNINRCILCGKEVKANELFNSKAIINGIKYGNRFNISDRFDLLQTMYLGMQIQYPQKSDKDIAFLYQQMINANQDELDKDEKKVFQKKI